MSESPELSHTIDKPGQQESPPIEARVIPNDKSRPQPPDGIIIHSMGQYIDGLFAAEFLYDVGLSAHYLIDHTGKIFKCVDPDRQAYHAGESRFNGQENLNSTFIGIELLIEGEHTYGSFLEAITKPQTFTEEHYSSATWLCKKLVDEYNISVDQIVRHSEVSGPDVRRDPKYDPGKGFDLNRLLKRIRNGSNGEFS